EAVGGMTKEKIFSFGDNPRVLREGFEKWLSDEKIEIIREHRIAAVTKDGGRIVSSKFLSAPPDEYGVPAPGPVPDGSELKVEAGVFIDASYEGDLMAEAGVSYSTGRESRSAYGEEPAGVGPPTEWTPIDPYVT